MPAFVQTSKGHKRWMLEMSTPEDYHLDYAHSVELT
jgi:hypothetical protein